MKETKKKKNEIWLVEEIKIKLKILLNGLIYSNKRNWKLFKVMLYQNCCYYLCYDQHDTHLTLFQSIKINKN